MQINYQAPDHFKIKTREAEVLIFGEKIKINDFEISEPGEYEVKNVAIESVDHTWILEIEGALVCFLTKANLDNHQLEKLKNIDILLIPSKKEFLKIIEEIDPYIVVLADGKESEDLIKAEGVDAETMSVLKISKKDLSEETRKFIVLE